MGNVEALSTSRLYFKQKVFLRRLFGVHGSVPLSDLASPEDLAEKADIIRKR